MEIDTKSNGSKYQTVYYRYHWFFSDALLRTDLATCLDLYEDMENV